jgi:hypothetical protein
MQDSLAAAVCIKVLAMADGVRLQTWLDSGTKERFSAVARHEGLSDSALLKRLVDPAANGQRGRLFPERGKGEGLPANRVSVRLRPEDVRLLQERATARGMRPATYLSVQARAHLHHLAPLPREELLALKRTVSELSAIGRNLNQIARAANRGDRVAGLDRQGVAATL